MKSSEKTKLVRLAFQLEPASPGFSPVENKAVRLRAGDACPRCAAGKLDYDGLLNLVCPVCQYTGEEGGCFT